MSSTVPKMHLVRSNPPSALLSSVCTRITAATEVAGSVTHEKDVTGKFDATACIDCLRCCSSPPILQTDDEGRSLWGLAYLYCSPSPSPFLSWHAIDLCHNPLLCLRVLTIGGGGSLDLSDDELAEAARCACHQGTRATRTGMILDCT